ncbi:MAG: hypothetical protein IT176_14445 [Acidobacteria bacterium]|nr:hypothetical protein [Acidobacteriota bacterium]
MSSAIDAAGGGRPGPVPPPASAFPRAARAASALGLALGVIWALSPLAVALAAAIVWMCAASVSRLQGRERVHLVRILALAIGLRFIAVGLLLVGTRPDREPFLALFPDAQYLLDRSLWIRNLWLGVEIGPHQWLGIVDPYAASSYPYLLAALQTIAGPSPYALCLLSVAFFTAGALLMHRMVRGAFGGPTATLALAATMCWPTLFAWSISVLREAFQFFLGALVAAGLYYAGRHVRRGWAGRALASTAAVAGALWMLSGLREGTLEIGLLAIALALAFRVVAARPSVAAALIALSLFGAVRFEKRIVPVVRLAADRHLGHVMSAGRSYQLLDRRFYAAGPASLGTMTTAEGLGFLARSAAAFVVMPLPWRAASVSEFTLVPQQIVWYLALAAALAGLAAGLRRDPWLTSVLAAYPIAGLLIIAPNSGNIGTLVRHRDMIVPFVLSLAAAGAAGSLHRVRTGPAPGATPAVVQP